MSMGIILAIGVAIFVAIVVGSLIAVVGWKGKES